MQTIQKIINSVLLTIFLCSPTVTLGANDSVIYNNVSVTANGGVSTTHIKTVHNGEVVEDTTISTTSPYHYESSYASGNKIVTYSGITNEEKTTDITSLTALLNQLRTLLAFYEKLLAKQTAISTLDN